MGEAKRRGTFEERKAQAIAEGRVKGKATSLLKAPHRKPNPSAALMAAAMVGALIPMRR